jgi:hypothetical protein
MTALFTILEDLRLAALCFVPFHPTVFAALFVTSMFSFWHV